MSTSSTIDDGRHLAAGQSGWRCPGCSKCYAPSVSTCPDCGRPGTEQRVRMTRGACCGRGLKIHSPDETQVVSNDVTYRVSEGG